MHLDDLTQQAVAVWRPMGLLEIKGKSKLDLLDRMSTNLVRLLQPGEGAATVLTTDVGRIIDRLLIYADTAESNRIIVVTGEENGDNIARYLLSFVFFNDDFHVSNLGKKGITSLFLYGEQATEILSRLSDHDLSKTVRHHWISTTVLDSPISIHVTDPIGGAGYMLLMPEADAEKLTARLAEDRVKLIDETAFEALRVQSGLPKLRHELAVEYIPLETGLWDDVSFNKGCYTGQEIIARMESRGKLARQLVPIEAEQPLEVGQEIKSEGKVAGSVTSAAGHDGLAYIKTKVLESEAGLEIAGNWVSVKGGA